MLCLIGLSAWPNLISQRAFGGGHAVLSTQDLVAADVAKLMETARASKGSMRVANASIHYYVVNSVTWK